MRALSALSHLFPQPVGCFIIPRALPLSHLWMRKRGQKGQVPCPGSLSSEGKADFGPGQPDPWPLCTVVLVSCVIGMQWSTQYTVGA